MKIIVDAMGGDNAPRRIIQGALIANRDFGTGIILVGRGETILQTMKDDGITDLPAGVEIAHAEQVVTMHDKAAQVVKEKPDSSMLVSLRLLSEDKGDAVVSAGNTGALLSASTLIVKRIKGIRRGALVPIMPTPKGNNILIDSGANVEASEEYLLQFALLGSAYSKLVMGVDTPKVGLLNNGTESTKGTPVIQRAYKLLEKAHDDGILLFAGNIEAREAVLGAVDVVVADGFTGNIYLKAVEGTGMFFGGVIKNMFSKNPLTKLAALLVYKDLSEFKKKMDYREVGGAPLLGMSKPVIKAHGSSDAYAIRGAIRQAIAYSESGYTDYINKHIDFIKIPKNGEEAGK